MKAGLISRRGVIVKTGLIAGREFKTGTVFIMNIEEGSQ
jgi:hypothetical protein